MIIPSSGPRLQNPISDARTVQLLGSLEPRGRLALAVSGGSDSTALMHLAARWCVLRNRPLGDITVLTVDHGLRAGSAGEAEAVQSAACALGFAAAVLNWDGAKPRAGLMAAAREARYRLMADHMRRAGIDTLVTAHTEDDQAETFLLRLARGSGVDGLSAMRPETEIAGAIVVRPLLRVSRARLRAYLRSIGASWIEDPGNDSMLFERVRMRRALRLLRDVGVTPSAIARTAGRLTRASDTLERLAADAAGRIARFDPAGFAVVDRAAFSALPADVRLRLLSLVLAAAGGSGRPPRLSRVEKLDSSLAGMSRRRVTLGGCLIEARPEDLRVYREPGRQPAAEVTLEPAAEMLWDGRFSIRTQPDLPPGLRLAPLGDAGWISARAPGNAALPAGGGAVPYRAALTTPALWRDGRCIAAPALGWCAPGCEAVLRAVTVSFRSAGRPGCCSINNSGLAARL
jgi:tRNA(Ile)-lysidine synthase